MRLSAGGETLAPAGVAQHRQGDVRVSLHVADGGPGALGAQQVVHVSGERLRGHGRLFDVAQGESVAADPHLGATRSARGLPRGRNRVAGAFLAPQAAAARGQQRAGQDRKAANSVSDGGDHSAQNRFGSRL